MHRHVRDGLSGSAVSVVVFLLGVALAGAASTSLQRDIDAQAQAAFERMASHVRDEVAKRFQQPIGGLNGARGMYAARGRVSRGEFRAYVASRDVANEFPGVRGLGFIQRVARAELADFVEAERADGAPQFAVRQLETKDLDDLYVIKFIEPPASNAGAQGLDIGSEARRRSAAQRAVDTGEATLTSTITLVQDARRTPGVLLYVPVYAPGAAVANAELRRASLVGLLYAPIVIKELLDGVRDVADGQVDFDVLESNRADAPTVYRARHMDSPVDGVDAAQARRFHATRTVSLPGLDYTLRVASTAQFEAGFAGSSALFVFAGGVAISALLALLLGQQSRRRERAEALARGMTTELDRLAQVARHTSNAVSITDSNLRITWVNEGFTRISGYTLDEARGRTHRELLGNGSVDRAAFESLVESDAGTRNRIKLLNRAKGGREYAFDADVRPIRDARGRAAGYMEIGSDVTERELAQARLEAALRETDALLRTIHMHAIVSVADRSGRIVEVNEAFCRISGYSREELLGANHRIVNSGVQPAAFWHAMWRTIASGTPWRGEVCNRAKDGSLYWVDTFIAPFAGADGRIEKYVSIRIDITASKDAAHELARERAALSNIIEGTNAGTWEWNLDSGAVRFNERWAQITGHTLDELGPCTIDTWHRLLHPDDRAVSEMQRLRHLSGELPAYECEVRLRHKDGHWVWVYGRGKLFAGVGVGVGEGGRWLAGTHMDISERKHAEAALRASQEFLDKAGHLAGVGGWSLDFATRAIEWTDETCRIHDREPGHRPTLAEELEHFALPSREAIERALQDAVAHGTAVDLELPMTTARGREIWVRVVGETEFVDGAPVRMVGALQDITARRALEAELRRNNEVMHSVLENLPCGLSVFDAQMNLVAANAEFRRLLELPDSLFETQPVRFEDLARFNAARGEYGPGDVEALVQDKLDQVSAPIAAHRLERVRPNGTPIEVRGAPMPGGGLVSTYTDLSGRRKAEAEALRASTLLRGSIDSLDDAFALYDPDDRLVLCNQRSLEAYPLSADLMVPGALFEHIIRKGAERGQYAQALGRIDAWVAERMALHRQPASMLTQRLSDGRTLRIVERRMPDGHTVVFRVDITELVRATEAAQAASHAMSRFLANMSHEIRTPMNAVLGMLTLLQRTELTPRQADYAAKADRAARSLLGLLNEILQFSKIEEGKTTLEALPFELEALLRELAVIVSGSAARKALEVRFEVDPALPRGWVGDAMRLRQVLVNLLGNAVKFTEQGEVVLQIALRSLDTTAAAIEFVVNDTGIGIAPENHARIFSGFTQAEVSTTRRFGGTGLGLAISQRLIRLMGGELALDSELGRGSRFSFCITLPVTDKRTVGLLRDRHGVPRARLVRACSCAGARGAAAHEQGVALGGGRGRRRWAGSDAAAAAGGGRCALPCDVRGCAHVCVGCCAGAAAPVRRRNERRAGHRSHRDGRRPRPRPARTTRRKPMHHAGPR